MRATTYPFGCLADGRTVTAARLETEKGASVTVLDYGAAIQSLCVPDREGNLIDVVLGYDTAAEYETNDSFIGGTIGRVGNRIGGAEFSLNGKIYQLAKNDGENHLHGGVKGFDKQMWNITVDENRIICERTSPDGEEGYPGNLQVRVTFMLTEENELHLIYDAVSDADTLVNLTNHSYFNLDGSRSVEDHFLQVFADRFCEGDAGCLPTGRLLDVTGTPFDFREAKRIGTDIEADNEQLKLAGGYDHNFCLWGRRAGKLFNEKSGICLTIETDMPGMQVYTSNFLPTRPGKKGSTMGFRAAVCLETQLYPNGYACYGFPSPLLRAGKCLHSETVFAFGVME